MPSNSEKTMILDLGANVKGNCQIDGYAGKIIVDSFSHSVSQPMQRDPAQSERTMGRPVFSDMDFSKMSDASTCELYKACAQGTKLGSATLHVGRIENGKFMGLLKYTLENAMVASISTSGAGRVPMDTFTLNFTKITNEYTQQNSDSTQKGTGTWNYDLREMKSS